MNVQYKLNIHVKYELNNLKKQTFDNRLLKAPTIKMLSRFIIAFGLLYINQYFNPFAPLH